MSGRLLSRSPWREARWLVIAPHADDETLGAGALIAEARDRLAGVVYLTDGAGSHPHSDEASRSRLRAIRRAEARAACRRLVGNSPFPVTFLEWPDAHPYDEGTIAYRAAVQRLSALCRRSRVDAIAVTASDEPHCDHAAAGRLAGAVARAALRPIRVFHYYVWGEAPVGASVMTARLDPGRRAAALASHRSQLTPLFGPGFTVPPERRRMTDRDRLYPRTLR